MVLKAVSAGSALGSLRSAGRIISKSLMPVFFNGMSIWPE